MLSGIAMLVKEAPPVNAPSPMLTTLAGIVMLVKKLQLLNVQPPMLVTALPNLTSTGLLSH